MSRICERELSKTVVLQMLFLLLFFCNVAKRQNSIWGATVLLSSHSQIRDIMKDGDVFLFIRLFVSLFVGLSPVKSVPAGGSPV